MGEWLRAGIEGGAGAAARRRQQRGQERQQEDGGRVQSRSLSMSGQSYWLDLWLFILFDVAIFLLIYLLP
uniref:HCV F-transactivated protein 1 n=1 Tax=Malurus cyaneus samueli TaxID=2593467 RepID=A0A8C5TWC3_9PASS